MGLNVVGQSSQAQGDKLKGSVKFWKDQQGWGFITGDDGRDYFVHYTQINRPGRKGLLDGERVSFHAVNSEKGMSAHSVTSVE